MKIFKKIFKSKKNSDYRNLFIIYIIISFMFGFYMNQIENMSIVNTYYYLITTATTVGYGDMLPQTNLGKIFSTIYMILGIGMIATIIGVVAEWVLELSSKSKKGMGKMKEAVDLIVIGYPNENKVREIIEEISKGKSSSNFKNIVLINDKLNEIPEWALNENLNMNIHFVKGIASDSEVLHRANILNTKKALILANEQDNISSDDFSSSSASVIEKLNSNCYTIVEKVRKDKTLFETTKCDLVVRVSRAEILAQEILNPGAIELEEAIFSNDTVGTQFNYNYQGEEISWSELAISFIKKGLIPEGFKPDGKDSFNLMPLPNDIISANSIIKYRGTTQIIENNI